jgi:hypothetical protein
MVHISSAYDNAVAGAKLGHLHQNLLWLPVAHVAIFLSSQENSLQKLFCTINCSCEIDFLAVLAQSCQRFRPILQLGSLLRH